MVGLLRSHKSACIVAYDAIKNHNELGFKQQGMCMQPFTLYGIILIEGFVTIAAEILTIRQLMPLVGNDIIVTSLIIGVFLLFLAYGYRKGGQYTQNFKRILKVNFIIAALLLGVGLSYGFVAHFFSGFSQYISQNTYFALVSYLLLITAPLVYLLGQTVPITMHLFNSKGSAGQLGGQVLHLSTIGSFLGSILTSAILMHFFGVALTVFINFCLLLLLVALVWDKQKPNWLEAGAIVTSACFIYIANVQIEKLNFIMTTPYGNYSVEKEVVDNENHLEKKRLKINNSYSSFLDESYKAYPYIEMIKFILFNDLKYTDKDILVLGAGGFTLSAENDYSNHFTYVDIDRAIKKVVENHYLDNLKGNFKAQDARAFINQTNGSYDAIVIDTYTHDRAIPAHLSTKEFYQAVKSRLSKDGVAILNVIASPFMQDPLSKRVDATIRSVFPHCMSIPINYSEALTNIIYSCQNDEENAPALVYLDNDSRVALDALSF